jgi:hypothetical protein
MNSLSTSRKTAVHRKGSRWLLSPGYRPSGMWVTRTAH